MENKLKTCRIDKPSHHSREISSENGYPRNWCCTIIKIYSQFLRSLNIMDSWTGSVLDYEKHLKLHLSSLDVARNSRVSVEKTEGGIRGESEKIERVLIDKTSWVSWIKLCFSLILSGGQGGDTIYRQQFPSATSSTSYNYQLHYQADSPGDDPSGPAATTIQTGITKRYDM